MEGQKEGVRHDCTVCGDNHCGHCCGGMYGGQHNRLARLVLKAAVILFVFWLGIQLGELKSFVRSGAFGGHGYMMRYYDGYGPVPNMMYRGVPAPATTSVQ